VFETGSGSLASAAKQLSSIKARVLEWKQSHGEMYVWIVQVPTPGSQTRIGRHEPSKLMEVLTTRRYESKRLCYGHRSNGLPIGVICAEFAATSCALGIHRQRKNRSITAEQGERRSHQYHRKQNRFRELSQQDTMMYGPSTPS